MTHSPFVFLTASLVRLTRSLVLVWAALWLAGCGSAPVAPLWQVDAKNAMERATAAYLEGNTRAAQAEMARVRQVISGTGRGDWLAHAELAYCAAQVASLELQPCQAFEALRADALPAQVAYANYLGGQAAADVVALLPVAQQRLTGHAQGDVAALQSQPDPLSRLVAAAVWLQKGHGSTAVLDLAIETASAQGWRRPLLAWLGTRLARAQQEGDEVTAAQLRRRIALAGAYSR